MGRILRCTVVEMLRIYFASSRDVQEWQLLEVAKCLTEEKRADFRNMTTEVPLFVSSIWLTRVDTFWAREVPRLLTLDVSDGDYLTLTSVRDSVYNLVALVWNTLHTNTLDIHICRYICKIWIFTLKTWEYTVLDFYRFFQIIASSKMNDIVES